MYTSRWGAAENLSITRIGEKAGECIIALIIVILMASLLAGCSTAASEASGPVSTSSTSATSNPSNNATATPAPAQNSETLENQLKACNIVLSETDSGQVRDWLKTDMAYANLAGLCLQVLAGKQVRDTTRPLPLDVINAKYKMQFGKQSGQYLDPGKYTDRKKTEQAIFLTWKERNSGAPQKDFSEITLPKPLTTVSIAEPANGTKVAYRQVVRGTVSDPKCKVWLVVHPMLAADYWVQNPINVKSNGQWTAQVYLGTSAQTQVGELFELRAVADPQAALKAGDVLTTWPDAKSQSNIVEVEREQR